jgi:hypothetical protein
MDRVRNHLIVIDLSLRYTKTAAQREPSHECHTRLSNNTAQPRTFGER